MPKAYNVLLLEDSRPDIYLIKRHLTKLYPQINITDVSAREDFETQLQAIRPDVILSDYRLPHYSGIEALLFTRATTPAIPFVFVTGALDNEVTAENTILKGAHAFVLKNNLEKLDQVLCDLFGEAGVQHMSDT
jgi:CheY-like chemotaxis protein